MARYDILEAGFSSLDETINFGRRSVSEDKSLYETTTLAVIRSSETISSANLNIVSYYQDGKIFFCINNILRLIRDKGIDEEIASFEFDHIIENFCVSLCGKFIFICTKDGKIVIKGEDDDYEENEKFRKFSTVHEESLENDCSPFGFFFKGAFVDDSVYSTIAFYVVTYQGLIKKIELNKETNNSFVSEIIYDLEMPINICAFRYPYLCLQGRELVLLDVHSRCCTFADILELKSLHAMGQYFFAYDNNENLYRISTPGLIMFCVNEMFPELLNNFDNLLFLEDGEKKSKVHILGVTKNSSEEKPKIKLMSILDQELIYSIPVDGPVHLMKVNNLNEEVLFFTEIHKNNCIDELRLQIIIKADPQCRVEKLIQKQLFKQAEIFAKTYNVSPEIIAKAKARHIINKQICSTKDIDELLVNLDMVRDELFKLNCCDIVDCEFGSDTRRVLCYGAFMNISIKDCEQNRDHVVLKMKTSFNKKLLRFDMFMQIYQNNYKNSKWKDFVECDLINEIKNFVMKGYIEEATTIVARLDLDAIDSLTFEKIEEITYMINEQLDDMTAFLSAFIPISLKYVPDSVVIFVRWLHGKVYQLEMQTGIEFPACAIKFVEDVIKLIKVNISVKKALKFSEMKNRLNGLHRSLNDLEELYHNYGIRIPLSEYLSGPSCIVKTLLYDNMNNNTLEAFMKNYVCPIILKNKLTLDETLVTEIRKLLFYDEKYWVGVVPILFNYISSIDEKLKISYEILEIANIPWSESIKDIARRTYQLAPSHPVAESIAKDLYNEEILITLHKYDIHRSRFESLDDKMFCFNRIIYLNRESMLEDIFSLCLENTLLIEANLVIMNKLTLKQRYLEAMSVMDKNKPENILILCENFFDTCLSSIASDKLPQKFKDCYYISLKLVWTRLKKRMSKTSLERNYELACMFYEINKNFGIHIKDLITRQRRSDILNKLVEDVTLNYIENNDFDEFVNSCSKLADIFKQSLDSVISTCLTKSKDLKPFIKLGEYILNSSEHSSVLCRWALYLFKFSESSSQQEESIMDVFYNAANNYDYLESFNLSRKLAIKAMMYASAEDHLSVLEVNRWINGCFHLAHPSNPLNTDILQIYHSNNTLNRKTSFEAIKYIFNKYCSIPELSSTPNMKYLTQFTSYVPDTPDQFFEEINEINWNLSIILNDGQHLTTFYIIKTIQQGLISNSTISKERNAVFHSFIQTKWLPKTLEAVVSYKYIDKALLYNLMLLCDNYKSQILNYLQAFKKQPNKLIIITQVGMQLFKYHKSTEEMKELMNIYNLCKWWNKITEKIISYDSFFTSKREDRFEALILTKQVNMSNLFEYCADFNMEIQATYLKYLEISLKSWQPKVKNIIEIDGSKNIVIINSETELEKECKSIVDCITNQNSVLGLIEQMWPTINFYYYEVFIVILSIHEKLSSAEKSSFGLYRPLLHFLKSYKRVSTPSRSEIEQWFGTFPLKAFIDPLSEFRLPLTSTFFSREIWTIIKPEVNIDTYQDWFKIAPMLHQFLNTNDICTYAINNALPSGLPTKSHLNWEIYSKHDHLIAKVEECAGNITDLERATAAVYTLMSNMPPGLDKVKMAELSYKYAQIYRDTVNSDDVEKVYIKVKQRHYNYSTIHILHKYELAEDKYLELVAQPLILISELYNDPRILKGNYAFDFQCPDINAAVDDICKLFGFSVKKVKFDILSTFLNSDTTLDLDITVTTNSVEDINDASINNIRRACYICESIDFHKTLNKIGMNLDGAETSMSFRANALRCFYYTNDITTIETVSQMNHDDFVMHLKKVSLISKIEYLGFELKTVKNLDELNKKKLLKELAKIHKPLAIRCIASICKIYEFDDLRYWEFIVNTAIQFRMIKDLRDYVEYLKARSVTEFIIKAWNVILSDAFMPDINDSDNLEAYIAALRLFQICPLIYALNVEEYIEKCISNKRPEIAAILLQYLSPEKHEAYLKDIKTYPTIVKDVRALQTKGITGISLVLRYII